MALGCRKGAVTVTLDVDFLSVQELFSESGEFDDGACGLETLLSQSSYSPSIGSVQKFIEDLIQSGSDSTEKRFFYVLRQAGQQRWLGLAQLRLTDDLADLDFVIISESSRGAGLAKILLENSLNEVRLAGAKRVLLEVGESNFAAQALYNRFGFSTISVRKKYYKNGENALIMELNF